MRTFHPVHGYSFLSQEAHQSTVWRAEIAPRSRRDRVKIALRGREVSITSADDPAASHSRHVDDGARVGDLRVHVGAGAHAICRRTAMCS